MTCYVDELKPVTKTAVWPYPTACHLLCDGEGYEGNVPDIGELRAFAKRLELKLEWEQNRNRAFVHFDLNSRKRRQALAHGAVEVSAREIVRKFKG